MHRRDADQQLVHEGGERRIDDEQHEHAGRHLGNETAHDCDQHGDRHIADAADAERGTHLGIAAGARRRIGVRPPQDRQHDLHERDEASADHEAVRHVIFADVDPGERQGIAADEQADAEHAQRPDVADERHAERRHGDLEPAAENADE